MSLICDVAPQFKCNIFLRPAEYFINARKDVLGTQFTTDMRVIVSERVGIMNVFRDPEQQDNVCYEARFTQGQKGQIISL